MASIGGLIYGFLFGAVIIVGLGLFVGGLQNNYASNIGGNATDNSTFANTAGIFTNTTSGFYGIAEGVQNTSSGEDLGAQISNAILYVIPGGQWAWTTIKTMFSMLTGFVTLTSDLIMAFNIVGNITFGGVTMNFADWLKYIIGAAITAFIGLEILSWQGKYKLQ